MVKDNTRAVVVRFAHELSDAESTTLMEALDASIERPDARQPRSVIRAKPFEGKARSIKSRNAFLDLRKFLKFLCEEALDAAGLYVAPKLFLPIAGRMMLAAREIVTRDLSDVETAVIMVLYLGGLGGAAAMSREAISDATAATLREEPFRRTLTDNDFANAIKILSRVGAITQTGSGLWTISERVEVGV